jgi:stress response protein SCP2
MSQQCLSMSKISRVLGASIVVLAGALPLTAEAQWVLVARHVVGRVQQVTQQQDNAAGTPQQVTQVATVVLDAPASRVYQVATNATNTNQQVTVVSNDPATMTINIREAEQQATLKVTALNKNTSQLMIVGSAPAGENPETTRIVNAALRLCGDLGKTCQVGNN